MGKRTDKVHESVAYILSRFFLYAAFATSLISFLLVRKTQKGAVHKILKGILLSIVLGGVLFVNSTWFFLISGKIS